MQSDEMIGKIIGHYRIVHPLGVGGTSLVFLAQDIHLHRNVALKLFQPRPGETQDFLRRFAREARVVAQLDHPNILPVYEYGEEHDRAYLVMPQMSGGSLRDLLHTRRTLPPQEAISLLEPILQALQYAHERGLIHRDIKPGNILFKADGTPMLADFGLVKVTSTSTNDETAVMSETTSMTGHAIAGTPDYMAPEQITGKALPTSDIYSIGVMLYEMLTGIRPFNADNYMGVLMKQMYERPRLLRDINPQISLSLEDVVLQAMEKEAPKRFQQPNDLRQALLQAINPNDSIATVSTWPTVEHSSFRKQQSGEQQPLVVRSTPVAPTAQTYNEADHALPSLLQENQQFHVESNYASTPQITTGGKLVFAQKRRPPLVLTVLGLLVVLVLLGGLGTALLAPQVFGLGQHKGNKPIVKTTPVVGNTLITQNVPTTTTTCPSAGSARPAILAPLVLGSHQNLVYIVNEFNPLQGTVKRREVNSTHGVEIVKMPNVTIGEAQVSQDGQWILFTAHIVQQDQLRLVRVDGQGLQTLYCAPVGSSIFGSQWSFNQQSVVFDTGPNGQGQNTMLLNIQSGDVQTELVPQGQFSYLPRTWLDATHIYLNSFPIQMRGAAIPQDLYLLDTQKGAKQHDGDLQLVVSTQACTSFDTSYDVKSLYLSICSSNGNVATSFNGPSSIMTQNAKGGNSRTIFSSQTLAITMVRAISPATLLLMVENTAGNSSQNGLWKMNTDGTGLTRLTADTLHAQALCQFSQYAWSNVSFDHAFYALQSYDASSQSYGMFYGSLNGGTPTQFANISDGTQLFLSGWTRL